MKRALLLGGLLATGSLSMTLAAFQAPAAPKVIEVEKLRDNLWVLKGGGGNTAVFVGSLAVIAAGAFWFIQRVFFPGGLA